MVKRQMSADLDLVQQRTSDEIFSKLILFYIIKKN